MGEKQRVIGAAGGALSLGTFAAALGACCGMPWVVALLGVTGAVAFARLAFLLPYALAGAAALLVIAFWWAYRKPTVCDDGTCDTSNRRALQWIVWAAALFVLALSAWALMSSVTWNSSGEFGRQLAKAVNLKNGDELVYAWDVWLIYGPETVWDGPNPPQPRLLMHQLRALQDSTKFPRLDSKVFAREARALLAKAPVATAASPAQE